MAHNDYTQHVTGTLANDQSLDISITVPAGVTSLKLGFGSTLDQPASDESYGIDNVAVVNSSQNPGLYAPSSSSLNLDYIKSTASLANRSVVTPGGTLRQVGTIPTTTNVYLASSGSSSNTDAIGKSEGLTISTTDALGQSQSFSAEFSA